MIMVLMYHYYLTMAFSLAVEKGYDLIFHNMHVILH